MRCLRYDTLIRAENGMEAMTGFWQAAGFAVEVLLPSVLMMLLGWFLGSTRQIDKSFCAQASKLVFNYGLPLLLFTNLYGNDIQYRQQAVLLTAGIVSTLILFIGAELYAMRFVPDIRDKGVFVQGVFRSNMGIMGLAFVQNAYGNAGLAAGAVYLGVVTIFFNILAVITLSRSATATLGQKLKTVGKKILTNPLIIAIVVALALQRLNVDVPEVLLATAGHIGHISLPLALICAGATFNVRGIRFSDLALHASIGRLLVAPVAAVLTGLAFGLNGIPLGVIFLMTATPVAAASYVMARAMGGNEVMAANIIGITTLGALVPAAAGVVLLRSLGWMYPPLKPKAAAYPIKNTAALGFADIRKNSRIGVFRQAFRCRFRFPPYAPANAQTTYRLLRLLPRCLVFSGWKTAVPKPLGVP